MMQMICPLPWDTERLGVNVAKIIPEHLNPTTLQQVLRDAHQQNYQLLYWATPTALENTSGLLVDEKITYCITLSSLSPIQFYEKTVEEYTLPTPCDDLIQLAFDSGTHSRFRKDPHLTERQFQSIYREWITNAVNKTIADKVLVIRHNNKIVGMITLGEKNHRGDIGLLAVSKQMRGQQLGKQLISAAQRYFIEKNYRESQVVTQKANEPACRLYERCRYHLEKLEYFYHFWI